MFRSQQLISTYLLSSSVAHFQFILKWSFLFRKAAASHFAEKTPHFAKNGKGTTSVVPQVVENVSGLSP